MSLTATLPRLKPASSAHIPVRLVVLLGLGLMAGPGASRAQTLTISGGATCPDCTIQRVHVASVGDTTGPLILSSQTHFMGGEGDEFYVFTTASPGVLIEITGDGEFVETHGRLGRGPGEYTRPVQAIPRGSGSRQIVDANQRRWTLLDAAGEVAAVGNLAFYFHHYVLLADGTLVANGTLQTRSAIGYPLHILNDSLRPVRSFAAGEPAYDPRRSYLQRRVLTGSHDGGFWSARGNDFELQKWTATIEPAGTVRRSVDWFETWTDIGTIPHLAPPKSRLEWMYEDDPNTMWVVAHVADANWERVGDPGHVPAVDSDNNRFYDSIVEVWDLEAGRVIAQARYDEYLFGFRNGQAFVYTAREDEIGNPFYDIWRFRLSRR